MAWRWALATWIVISSVNSLNAAVYDLTIDWSDTANPNGVWSLYKNSTSLFAVNQSRFSYANGHYQPAWADQVCYENAHVPCWGKSLDSGVVFAHGSEFDRTGSNVTFARWTSPVSSGWVTVSGSIWTVTTNNRFMDWLIRCGSETLASGSLYSNGQQGEANATNYADHQVAPSALTMQVDAGDTIDLVLISISESGNLGDSLGMTFAVTTIPEPASLGLLAFGCVGLFFRGRRP